MARKKTKRAKVTEAYDGPTAEQLASGTYHRELVTYRRTPVIDVLFQEHKLTQRQYDGLSRYREVALKHEKSPIKCNIDFSVPGNGEGLPHFGVRAKFDLERLEARLLGKRKTVTATTLVPATKSELLLGRVERELKDLRQIARAVAVEGQTLSEWAVSQSGGTERLRGAVTAFEPSAKAYKRAWMDIRMAGEWLAAGIGA